VPFADQRLVELGMALPDALKYRDGRGKWLIRQWAARHLPQDHLAKPKRGFYVPVKEWLQGDFLQQLGQKLLGSAVVEQWFERDGLRQILAAQAAGKNHSRDIWSVMQFAIWYRLFIDQPGIRPAAQENPLDWL